MTFNNETWSAITTMEFDFEGKSAHAAAMPWDGRRLSQLSWEQI